MTSWTQLETWSLEDAIRSGGLARAYAAFPTRSRASVYRKAVEAGFHFPPPIDESDARPWTASEDHLLFRFYPTLAAAGLLRDHGIDRTRVAIVRRAGNLGLKTSRKAPVREVPMGTPWTSAEEEIVRLAIRAQPDGVGLDWLSLQRALPDRTRASIACKIETVRAGPKKRAARRPWSTSEDALVVAEYASVGAQALAERLGRSHAAVTNRAYDLRVTKARA